MLYVFQMDVGQMLTFEISLLMDTVSTLQQELARVTGIGVDKQILLVSGGHSLKPQQKVISYGAGTDTNPVFLFSKLAIESQEPPLVKSFGLSKEVLGALKDRITEAVNLPVSFETVTRRTKVACEIRDNANRMLAFCSNEFKEQHLQYQGWGTVVANLEEIAQAMQKTQLKFKKAFTGFLPQREKYFKMLENFHETISLLDRIPLLKSLKEKEADEALAKRDQEEGIISFVASTSGSPTTLLEWITTQGQGQSVDALQLKCFDDLHLFDSEMFAQLDREVQEQLSLVTDDPHHMKELMGIERRLSELEKRLNEAKRITQEQNDMAQGFLNQQARLSSTQSPALILPDLCRSHQQQLQQMLDRQQRIETLQNNFKKSKQEMSTNIHQRLGWVMHIETRISKLDSDLIYHMKTLRMLECNLELLSQIKAAPQVYADMVVEAARRRLFSSRFTLWAEALVDDSKQMYLTETERRKQFTRKLGEHFLLDTLFKGFDDMPPSFATRTPPPFDTHLPEVTVDDISLLRNTVPELEEFLNMSVDAGSFSLSLLSKIMYESPQLQMVMPQSSQTEWSYQSESMTKPCIIVATEAPPTKFTLPEVQESLTTECSPVTSSLADAAKDVITSQVKPVRDDSSLKEGEPTSESSSSAAAFEPSPAVQSVKTQTKTNSTHTDSTSPISSNEFATADFYFEDSMPSPMADSPIDKTEEEAKEKKMEDVKPDSDTVASLQVELAEKVALILMLEQKLKEKDVQLSDSDKLSSQKGSSTDESSTLVATTDILDMTAASSDSGEVVSGDFYSTVFDTKTETAAKSSTDEPDEENKLVIVREGVVSGSEKDALESPTSCIRCSAESVRIQNLEVELAAANSDLCKLKESLSEAETKFLQLQEDNEKVVCGKDCVIASLQSQVLSVNEELLEVKHDAESKAEVIKRLENSLEEVKAANDKMGQDLKSGNERLETMKSRFLELIEKVKTHLPSLKESLAELRKYVADSRSNVGAVVSSAVSSVESQVSLFSNSVLSNAQGEFEKEREQFRSEIQQLKLELHKSHSEASEKVVHLTSMNEELLSQAEKQEKDFAMKCEEQRRDFDAALKDLETKHTLEMEIELDKVRGEVKDSLEEVERLNRLKDDLHKELYEIKQFSEKQKEDLEKAHKEDVAELKSALIKDKEDTVTSLNLKFESELDEKEQERKSQLEEMEARIESVRTSLVAEKEFAVAALNEQIIRQQEAAVAELKQEMKHHEENLAEVLEDKQLDHAHKLTQLKMNFDMERESLVAEINKLTNWEKSHTESQTEHHLLADLLTNSDTQTEIVHVTEVMAHSETQTGMELLADVISLTSSASYGSEEMIAHKQLPTLTDDRDSKESETVSKLHQTIDDLSVQLARAQEKIAVMEGELTALQTSQQAVGATGLGGLPDRRVVLRADSTHRDFMQTGSCTASFMIMDKEPTSLKMEGTEEESAQAKDKRIAELEKKLMELSMTASERETTADKVSIRGCDKGDLVLLCLDERHDQYVVFTVGTILHFLHSESRETLGLKTYGETTCRKSWILAEVVDKEYCLAKKPNNRFRVPQGTCFYRVKCKPWKCDSDAGRLDQEASRHVKTIKHDPSSGARAKKSEKQEEPMKY